MRNDDYSSPTITNCIFNQNSAEYGGGMFNLNASATLNNCILWDNQAPDGAEMYLANSNASVSYTDLQGGQGGIYVEPDSTLYWGQGNINADPCFVQPRYQDANGHWVEGDYHLLEGSPCIDSGDPNYIAGPNETDLDGNPRVVDGDNDGNSVVDMGAYEYRPPTPAELVAELLEGVGGLELPRGIANSLLAKLDTALQKLEDNNENNDAAAINLLQAFINAIQAQRGKKIPGADADALITAAQEIIELLSDE